MLNCHFDKIEYDDKGRETHIFRLVVEDEETPNELVLSVRHLQEHRTSFHPNCRFCQLKDEIKSE